jgi:hypothetical protein
MIQTDKGLAARLPLDPYEHRGQLQPIRCPQGVPLEGVRGVVPDGLAGEDLRPGRGEVRKKRAGVLFIPRLEEAFPPQAREGGPALHQALSQITENRKVEARKPLIFRNPICGFCLKKANLRQSPAAFSLSHIKFVPYCIYFFTIISM